MLFRERAAVTAHARVTDRSRACATCLHPPSSTGLDWFSLGKYSTSAAETSLRCGSSAASLTGLGEVLGGAQHRVVGAAHAAAKALEQGVHHVPAAGDVLLQG
jgi:hypothetical protein